MCMDPVSIALIAGTAATAGGQLYSGIAGNKAAKENASALEQQAELRKEKGEYDVAEATRRHVRDAGTKQAAAAATGIDVQSFADIFADDSAESALEVSAIRYGANADAYNIQRNAASTRTSGKNGMVASVFAAAGTVGTAYGKRASIKSPSGNYAPHEN